MSSANLLFICVCCYQTVKVVATFSKEFRQTVDILFRTHSLMRKKSVSDVPNLIGVEESIACIQKIKKRHHHYGNGGSRLNRSTDGHPTPLLARPLAS